MEKDLISRREAVEQLEKIAESSLGDYRKGILQSIVVVEGISSVKKDTPDNLLVDLRDVLENYSDLYWNDALLAFKDELDAVYENIRNLANKER